MLKYVSSPMSFLAASMACFSANRTDDAVHIGGSATPKMIKLAIDH